MYWVAKLEMGSWNDWRFPFLGLSGFQTVGYSRILLSFEGILSDLESLVAHLSPSINRLLDLSIWSCCRTVNKLPLFADDRNLFHLDCSSIREFSIQIDICQPVSEELFHPHSQCLALSLSTQYKHQRSCKIAQNGLSEHSRLPPRLLILSLQISQPLPWPFHLNIASSG